MGSERNGVPAAVSERLLFMFACVSLDLACQAVADERGLRVRLRNPRCTRIDYGVTAFATRKLVAKAGAGGGTRTPTVLPPADFESAASANFATPARAKKVCITCEGCRQARTHE